MPRSQSGFTLIEVLLAVSITVVVAVMSYQGLDAGMKLAERSQVESDRIHAINRVFDILGKDFKQIIARKVRAADGDGFEDAFYYNESSMPMLRFTRAGWTNPQPERFQRSQLQRVNYSYDGEKLTRQSWQMLDRYDDSEAVEITLLKDVKLVTIRLLQEVANPAGHSTASGASIPSSTEWVTQWPAMLSAGGGTTSGDESLPVAVEITIDVDGWGPIRRVYELVSGPY